MRSFLGLLMPKIQIMGYEVAGRVKAVGAEVKHLKAGAEVYGGLSESGFGGLAEHMWAGEASVALKPTNLTYAEHHKGEIVITVR